VGRWGRWLGAACLVLFPLLFIVFAGTDIHPGPSGTTQEQIQLVAAAEGRWRLVHLVLAAASLLGIGAVVTLWWTVVRGRSGILARVGDLGLVFGVAGAALLSGVTLMEAGLVAPLAVACGESPACLSPDGVGVAEAITGLGWRNVDPLTWAGGPLATGLLLLGLAGGLLRSLRVWEAALLVLAAIGLVFTNPGLHAPAHDPLVFVLVVFASLALRWPTGRGGRCGSVTGRAGRPRRSGGPWLGPGERGTRAHGCWGSRAAGPAEPPGRLCGSDDAGIRWSPGRRPERAMMEAAGGMLFRVGTGIA
jgi:hypothetical protein